MSGKAYTMKEMKSIVEYLVEHKAYSETKGRKMWVTFASSQMTTRTWQSLKETFLKRILPDIQNPYYKLTMEQVRSFKEGNDVEAKARNKLEIQTVSDSSTTIGQTETNGEKPASPSNQLDLPTGEDIQCAQITRNRSSVDTVVLDDPYYSNAEEIQNVLENTTESDNEVLYKPLKDCLTFEQSEPYNSDAMKVLQDFATDSEGSDKDSRLKIDENPPPANTIENRPTNEPIEIEDSEETPDLPNDPIDAEANVPIDPEANVPIDPEANVPIDPEANVPIDPEANVPIEPDANVPIEPDANVMVFIPDNSESILHKNQTDTNHKNSKNKQPETINDEPVEIIDQSDTNNDESDVSNMDTDIDKTNVNNDVSDVNNETSEVNNDQATETLNSTEENQDKLIENHIENIVENVTPLPENNSVTETTKAISPETVQTNRDEDILNEKENPSDSPKNIRISEPIPTSNATVNSSSNITDSLIPNNQEALNEVTNNQTKLQEIQEKTKNSRKRSISHVSEGNKKMKMDNSSINTDKSVKVVENQTTNKDQTDMRKMDSEDMFSHLDDLQNKVSNGPTQDRTSDVELIENLENEEATNNPCLKSVSLYAEQFNTTKLVDTDSEVEVAEQSNSQAKQPESSNSKIEFNTDPILLKSHSESDDNDNKNKRNVTKPVEKVKERVRKEKALANMLGFGGPVNRKRRMSQRRSRHSTKRHSLNRTSDSSEWSTSESDSDEYISPPRGRRSRKTKYLKPKSARIMALEEEGCLFVVHGKKIYPLIKNGRHIKSFLALHDEGDSEEERNSYWRQKYVEEKIRASELEKRLKSKESGGKKARISETSDVPLDRQSPILRSNTAFRNPTSHKLHPESSNKDSPLNGMGKELENPSSSSQGKVKIHLTKNNQEVELEGYWPQIHPALHQIVELFQNNVGSNVKSKRNTRRIQSDGESNENEVASIDIDSGKTTPIIPSADPVIHEKVSKIENEIFKEIEKQAKQETPKLPETDNINVKKRGRARSTKSTITPSTSKTTIQSDTSKPASRQSRKSSKTEKDSALKQVPKESTSKLVQKQDDSKLKQDQIEESSKSSKTRDSASKQIPKESTSKHVEKDETILQQDKNDVSKQVGIQNKSTVKQDDSTAKQDASTSKQDASTSKQDASTSKQDASTSKQDASTSKQDASTSKQNKTASKIEETVVMKRSNRGLKRLVEEKPIENRISTRLSASKNSGQSDDDDIRYKFPPNKKDTNPTVKNKRSSQHPAQIPEESSLRSIESTQGYQDSDGSPINIKRKRKPSFKVYKSKKLVQRKSLSNLTDILSSDSSNSSYFIPVRKSQSTLNSAVYKTDSYEWLMPKEKALMDPINENENDEEVQHFSSLSKSEDRSSSSNLMVEICSSSNVSLPLSPELSIVENLTLSREKIKPNITLNDMDCVNVDDVNTNYDKYMISNIDVSCPLMEQECGLQNSIENANKKSDPVSESHNDRVTTATMEEKSISETINKKLHDLLIESAKKMSNKDEHMDVDETNIQTKAKPKKRSSTPRKRKTAKNQKLVQVNSLIEEEYMETCSFAGRISCPPVITVIPPDDNENFPTTEKTEKKAKKKKDVIKVKIQRPKSRTRVRATSKNSTKSSITDSGINETGNFSGLALKGNDSVDLIHNHSDTCLNANECFGDSLIFIESPNKSVISLNSDSSNSELKRLMGNTEKSVDTFSNDGQDKSAFTGVPNLVEEIFRSPSATMYHSPAVTNSSLITEDLSDDAPPQPNKWFLFSDDDTNTQQFQDTQRSYGANLNHIFTSCAVPNLSTITEKSVDSRKFNMDGNTQNCDSQSLS